MPAQAVGTRKCSTVDTRNTLYSVGSMVLLGPLRLPAPVVIAAGCAGFDPAATARATGAEGRVPLGAFVTAGAAATSRRGGRPLLVETPGGAMFTPGDGRAGIRAVVRRHARAWAASPVPVLVNLVGDTAVGFGAAAGELEGLRGVVGVELSLGHLFDAAGAAPDEQAGMVSAAVGAVRRACGLPAIVKLPYATADPLRCIRAAGASGACAATVGGGIPVRDGLLIGPATFPLCRALLARVAPDAALPVIASGGIASPVHARAYLTAGAAAVQVGSALFANPALAAEIAVAL